MYSRLIIISKNMHLSKVIQNFFLWLLFNFIFLLSHKITYLAQRHDNSRNLVGNFGLSSVETLKLIEALFDPIEKNLKIYGLIAVPGVFLIDVLCAQIKNEIIGISFFCKSKLMKHVFWHSVFRRVIHNYLIWV